MVTYKKTLLEFIQEFAKVQPLIFFSFSGSVYNGMQNPIHFKCRRHGELTGIPKQMLRPDRVICVGCKTEAAYRGWLKKAKETHGDKYDYSNVKYVNTITDIEIICPKHGSYTTQPYVHLKHNCLGCTRENDKSTTKEFIRKAKLVHGDKYDYTNTVYTTVAVNVVINCPVHGDWRQRPSSHLSGNGCKECHISSKCLGNDEFIKTARLVHGKKYDYTKVKYTTSKQAVEIICPKHGIFKMKPNSHVSSKQGCKRCRESYGELLIRNFLDEMGIDVIQEYRMPGYLYRMDFYLPEENVYIEFHGKQHYTPVNRFGGVDALKGVQERDAVKAELSKDAGIPLIVIHYEHLKNGTLIEYLKDELTKVSDLSFQ